MRQWERLLWAEPGFHELAIYIYIYFFFFFGGGGGGFCTQLGGSRGSGITGKLSLKPSARSAVIGVTGVNLKASYNLGSWVKVRVSARKYRI